MESLDSGGETEAFNNAGFGLDEFRDGNGQDPNPTVSPSEINPATGHNYDLSISSPLSVCLAEDMYSGRDQPEDNQLLNSRTSETYDTPSILDLFEIQGSNLCRHQASEEETSEPDAQPSVPTSPRHYTTIVANTDPPGSEDEIWHDRVSEGEDVQFSDLEEDQTWQSLIPATSSDSDDAFLEEQNHHHLFRFSLGASTY